MSKEGFTTAFNDTTLVVLIPKILLDNVVNLFTWLCKCCQ